jgi:uracil-DNA glycosylase family protein
MATQKKPKGAAEFVPARANLNKLREAVANCKGCDLYKFATQAVFGEGLAKARIVLIGEQPGDQEDRTGRPFVGPAGEVLDRALYEAGIERKDIYVTNAVKHFAFEERGRRRIHRTPRQGEVTACHPWLVAEIAAIEPEVVVCLGATAAKALFGATFRLTVDRGKFLESRFGVKALATYHPSAILRDGTAETRHEFYKRLVEDLKSAAGKKSRRT